jgi:tRNA A-37 threonylcarbamoyl transferase component Bud32
MTPQDLRRNGTVIRYDADVLAPLEPQLFNVAWLRAQQLWQGSTQGRSQAHFFHYAGRDMVLRHFHRGGLVGRVNRDRYLRMGAAQSRPLREFDLLQHMRNAGLPVPLPVAARYVPIGPFYRADIITQRIPNAAPLQEVLQKRALPALVWADIGAQVRNLHQQGIFHSDLNCRNILMDQEDRVWFIDFDKCDRRAPGTWVRANLDRLERSLKKSAARTAAFHWGDKDWADFLAGYGAEGRP